MNLSHEGLFSTLYTDPELMCHVAPVLTPQRAKRLFSTAITHQHQGRRHEWVASDPSNTPIAIVGLVKENRQAKRAEIGTVIKASHHGDGYASELLDHVMRIGFENLGLTLIGGSSTKENMASFVLMNRLGFSHVDLDEIPVMHQPGYAWELTVSTWKSMTNKPHGGKS